MIIFSIVTVTYNAEEVIRPTLESVEQQDYPDLEHIIIDGASKDNTMAIVNEYAKRTQQDFPENRVVKVVSEPDKGIYDAMNKALRMVTGDYVCFLNAGDRFPTADTLSRVAATAEGAADGQTPAVLYGDTDIVDNEGNFLSHRHLSAPDNLTWRSFRHGMLVCHQAFYARTDIARNVKYDTSLRLSADVDWCIKVMREADTQGLRTRRVPTVIAHYLQEGQTTQNHRKSLMERFTVMRRHYGLPTTIAMHLYFVPRAITRKLKRDK